MLFIGEEAVPSGYNIETRIVGPGLLTTRAVTKKLLSGDSYILADYVPWDDRVEIATYDLAFQQEHVEHQCGPMDLLLESLRTAHDKIQERDRYPRR